jgi:hypothetical protein
MKIDPSMLIRYPTLGICGLSCRLCPRYQSEASSRCEGCKTESRLGAACSIQTCALKKQKVEYCGFCRLSNSCRKWADHCEAGLHLDSFVSYQKINENISLIQKHGLPEWDRLQREKERMLRKLIDEYDEGRSRSYLCLAVTLLDLKDLASASNEERKTRPAQSDLKSRSKEIHRILERIAEKRKIRLALRK